MTSKEQDLARLVERVGTAIAEAFTRNGADELSDKGLGFALWVFEFETDPFIAMVSNEFSNARRPELIRLMREHLARLEADEAREREEQH